MFHIGDQIYADSILPLAKANKFKLANLYMPFRERYRENWETNIHQKLLRNGFHIMLIVRSCFLYIYIRRREREEV